MKRVMVIVSVLLFAVTALHAQEKTSSMAAPLQHPKQVYVDQQQRIYLPVEAPIYLRLSTSPDGGAPSYLLQSEATPKFANPMYLDGPGRHTLRHKDLLHNVPDSAVVFYLYADGAAPATTAKLVGAPKHTAGKTIFYGKNLQAEMTTTDDMSGVQQTYVSIDGTDFKPYPGTTSFDQEKAYNLRYYAVDNVGNAATPVEKRFAVDLTPPTTKHTVQNIHKGNILSPKATIALTSTDLLSGIRRIYYTFDAQQNKRYRGNPLKVAQLSDGDHQLSYYAEDYVGNIEATLSYDFYLDKIPPVATATIVGDQYQSRTRLYVSGRSQVQLTATDNKSGVESIDYEIDTPTVMRYTDSFALPTKSGLHRVRYTATDNVENVSPKQTLTLYLDLTVPRTRHRFSGAQFSSPTTLFITNQTKISLSATDRESGVQSIQYLLDAGTTGDYIEPITVAAEGAHELGYFTIDRVNNREENRTVAFVVDNSPPEITPRFSLPSSGKTQDVEGAATLDQYPRHVILYLAATDQLSGVDAIFYTIGSGTERIYRNPIRFQRGGNYTISIRTVDKVGNVGRKTIRFAIE